MQQTRNNEEINSTNNAYPQECVIVRYEIAACTATSLESCHTTPLSVFHIDNEQPQVKLLPTYATHCILLQRRFVYHLEKICCNSTFLALIQWSERESIN